MLWRFFGKKWYARIEGQDVRLVDTTHLSDDLLCRLNEYGDWYEAAFRVPPYIRWRIHAKLRRLRRDHQRTLARNIALANKALPPEEQL